MKDRVHFFSTDDMSVPHYLRMAENVITTYENGRVAENASEFIELLHIIRYVENNVHPKSWTEERIKFIESQNDKVARFFTGLTKESWVEAYKSLEFEYKETFFEAIDKYGAISCINDENSLTEALSEDSYELRYILQCKRIVDRLNKKLTILITKNKHSAEWLLSNYAEESSFGKKRKLYFPPSLTLKDKEQIVLDYINSPDANLNYVRLALVSKTVKGEFVLSDKTRLAIKRRERELNDAVLADEHASIVPLRYQISMSDVDNVPPKWADTDEDGYPILCYSSKFLLRMTDADLLHYCWHVFEMVSKTGFVNLVNKESESGVMERVIGLRGKHEYETNMAFRFNEAVSKMQTVAMSNCLEKENRSLEGAITQFYNEYLGNEYNYPSLPMKLSSQGADWIEKIRNLLPEFESVFHQYHLFAQNGEIDEELLRIASPVKFTDIESAVESRYYAINGKPNDLLHLFYVFFSDQSMLTYVSPHKDKHYSSYFEMLVKETEIPYDNYLDYQKHHLEYVLSHGYLKINESGNVELVKGVDVLLLKQLYEYHACSYWAYDERIRAVLDEMKDKGWLKVDNHLLSKKERDYFSYYLNNEKFTNGPALRNRYDHGVIGSSVSDEQHKNNYYRLLNLLILYLLKIEDDLKVRNYLCLNSDAKR